MIYLVTESTLYIALWGSPVLFDVDLRSPFPRIQRDHRIPFIFILRTIRGQRAYPPPTGRPSNLLSADTNKIIFQKMPILDLKATMYSKLRGRRPPPLASPLPIPLPNSLRKVKPRSRHAGLITSLNMHLRPSSFLANIPRPTAELSSIKIPMSCWSLARALLLIAPSIALVPSLPWETLILEAALSALALVWYTGTLVCLYQGGSGAHSNDRYGHISRLGDARSGRLIQKFVVNQTDALDATSLGSRTCPNPFGNLTEPRPNSKRVASIPSLAECSSSHW